jgi:adenylyltransferase/sulfurtransferase
MNQRVPEITVEELKARLDGGDAVTILDVREPNEVQICRIEGSTAIPLGQLSARVSELNPDDELIVHCKMGGRSAHAVEFLRQRGFSKAYNLAGGILAWVDRIDPSQSKY